MEMQVREGGLSLTLVTWEPFAFMRMVLGSGGVGGKKRRQSSSMQVSPLHVEGRRREGQEEEVAEGA